MGDRLGIGLLASALLVAGTGPLLAGQPALPPLSGTVNDFAGVIDPASRSAIERVAGALTDATGDVIVVATVETVAPSGIQEYAVRLFENRGRGIGGKGEDNGILVLLAVKDRQVRIEVGYGLEEYITDGFAGETSRLVMVPEFRAGRYGAGLRAGVERLAGRLAEAREVTIEAIPTVQPVERRAAGARRRLALPIGWLLFLLLYFLVFRRRHRRHRRRGHWSRWSSGVGPFGGGFSGGFGGGGGGFGGGFGGFGGGASGGGGGGASW